MKKLICVFVAAILLLALLAGCKGVAPKEFSEDGFTLKLTQVYLEYDEEDEDRPFFYGNTKMGVVGLREDKAYVKELYPEITLEQYGRLLIALNEQESTVETKQGVPYYQYEAAVDGELYTYLAALYETEDSYWAVQVYCKSADYAEMESQLWEQATAVTIE